MNSNTKMKATAPMKKFFILALVVTSLSTNTSCMKKQDLDNEDMGPAVAPTEFTKTLTEGFGVYDYNLIKPNETNSLVTSAKIQDSFSQVLEKQVLVVHNTQNLSDRFVLDLLVTREIYNNGQSSSSSHAEEVTFNKSYMSTAKTLENKPEPSLLLFDEFIAILIQFCREQSATPTSCHRLTSQEIRIKVPASQASHHGCADANNCTIGAKKIEFDLLKKFKLDQNGKPERNHYSMVLSREAPFMSRVLQLCSRGLTKFSNSNQPIVADICYTVDNYAFGQ